MFAGWRAPKFRGPQVQGRGVQPASHKESVAVFRLPSFQGPGFHVPDFKSQVSNLKVPDFQTHPTTDEEQSPKSIPQLTWELTSKEAEADEFRGNGSNSPEVDLALLLQRLALLP